MAMPIPSGDTAQMQVQVPQGATPGMLVQVQAPSGQMLQVAVPPGLQPGAIFAVQVPGIVAATDEDEYEAYSPLPDIRFDVSDPFEQIMAFIAAPCLGITQKTLDLTDQEVTFRVKNLCGVKKQKRPYAQLGSVDKHTLACGCHTLVSDFSPLNEKGEGGLRIGCCGTDADSVDRIVQELQMRKQKRGGIAQIRKLDYVIDKMAKIGTQVPLLLNNMQIPYNKKLAPNVQKTPLALKTYDVTNTIEQVCACTTKTLTLDAEEAQLTINGCCGLHTINTKREYGQLGFVEKRKNCVCCFTVASDISPIPGQSDMAPGCPCTNRAQVSMIVRELRDRMATRGQVGQIKKQEKILGMIADVEENMKLIVSNRQLAYPPSQEEMKARFGEDAPDLSATRPPIETIEPKNWDVTSKIDSCLGCCCTCGIAGCTSETLELKEDDMFIKTKNNIDDSDVKIPYAEMDSVDMSRSCCCCYTVNEQTPGYGCDKNKVQAITAELQQCKYKRGNIAHLQQLRSMQTTAVGVEIMADLLMQSEGIQYPPTPEVMSQVFPGKKPRALTHEQKVHIQPYKEFDTKEYSVTNYISSCIGCICCPCCGPTTNKLTLGPDEMLLETANWCNRNQSRTPYGNLGAVETETSCCCCSELPDIGAPGFGCSNDLVNEIAAQLQERKEKRGNIAQMMQQENIIIEVLNLEAKADMLINKRGIQYPPAPEVMAQIFASSWPAAENNADGPTVIGAPAG